MKLFYSKYLSVFNFISDILLLNFSLYVVFKYSGLLKTINDLHIKLLFLVINLSWLLISRQLENYAAEDQIDRKSVMFKMVKSVISQAIFIISLLYLFKLTNSLIYPIIGFQICFFLAVLLIHRLLLFGMLNYLRRKNYVLSRICIAGDEDNALHLIDLFAKRVEHDYKVIDFISKDELNKFSAHEFIISMKQKKVNEVIICFKENDNNYLTTLIDEASFCNIQVKLFSAILNESSVIEVVNFKGLPLLSLNLKNKANFSKLRFIKRLFDIAFSVLVIIPGLPIFIILAIITKLTSKGPVFYKQQRIGRHSKPFYIYKFRSMYVDSERNGPQLANDNDPRITPWGRFMRKSRLDELPQFWNAFKGDMSIVGPRPERQHYIEQIIKRSPNYNKLLHVRPGITSIGQVQYGYAENVDQMCNRLEYDLEYLGKMNINRDVNIIMNTIKVMLQGKGK